MKSISRQQWLVGVLSLSLVLATASPGAASAASTVDAQTASKLKVQSRLNSNLNIPRSGELTPGAVPFLKSSTSTNTPKNFVPESDSSNLTTVIVQLQNDPIKVFEKQSAGANLADHASKVRVEHNTFKSAAQALRGLTFKREYSKVFNGYSVELPANQVDGLLKLPGVKAVFPNLTYHAIPVESTGEVGPSADNSIPYIGAPKWWEEGYKGKGVKVAVIDTGVDYNHPSLKGAYKGGYDFVDNDKDPSETRPDPTKPPIDGKPYDTEHGTHVSGTIVGRGNPNDSQGKEGWARGVAPEADLYVYRVLGPYGNGTTENVVAGIEEAVADGNDVINLSLGSDFNNQYTADSIAVDNAVKAGVEVAVSAGNEGPGDETLGSPGGSQLAISVGASTPPGDTPIFKSAELGDLYAYLTTYSPELKDNKDGWGVAFAGLGKPADFAGVDVKGKIALISRGEISFHDKAVNAKAAGAAGVIIFNNVPGEIQATLGSEGDYVPTYTITQEDGLSLKAKAEASDYKIHIGAVHEQDLLADFSSRGPALPDYSIKPDITAPGVAITSSIPSWNGDYSSAYESLQGTSMASPHVAGAAALLIQRSKSESKENHLGPEQIKALLTNNAVEIHDRSGTPYSVQLQGAGRIDLGNALTAEAIASVKEKLPIELQGSTNSEYQTGSLSFGLQAGGATVTKEITLNNIAGTKQTYDVQVNWTAEGKNAPSLISSNQQITLQPGQKQATFTVKLTVPKGAPEGKFEGQVLLVKQGDGHTLRLPASVYVGEDLSISEINNIAFSNDIFSPNKDYLADTTDVSFNINYPIKDFDLVVNSDTEGDQGTLYNGLNHAPVHNPDNYTITDWDARVTDHGQEKSLKDGLYWLTPVIHDTNSRLDKERAPFVVDREAPKAEIDQPGLVIKDGDGTKGTISGKILGDTLLNVLPNVKYSDVIGVAVLTTDPNGTYTQADGVIDDNGHFSVDVPVYPDTDSSYEVYVYDAASNGLLTPLATLKKNQEQAKIYADPQTQEAKTNAEFQVGIKFATTAKVSSASFSLQYPKNLKLNNVKLDPSAVPNAQDAVVTQDIVDAPNGDKQLNYSVSLKSGTFTGSGQLASVSFQSADAGNYSLTLASAAVKAGAVQVPVTGLNSVQVVVKSGGTDPGTPEPGVFSLDSEDYSLLVGEQFETVALFTDQNGKVKNVSSEAVYTSKNPKVVTVDKDGTLTGVSKGVTQITATYKGHTVTVGVLVVVPYVKPSTTTDSSLDSTQPKQAETVQPGVAQPQLPLEN
ncbi:S8 family serine peptidase [Paenibacillus sp. SN-8-1]|uniref:S8 family serine peptidase n=1 Tax=Paenibacillus sp. SN-8-1 TaxID=3435409 RepID=UPI003D9A72E4